MGQRGPKKLSSQQLKLRGSKLALVRAKQEAQARIPSMAAPIPMPADIRDPVAIRLWQTTLAEFTLDQQGLFLLREACGVLAQAEACKRLISKHGMLMKGRPNPAAKLEREYRRAMIELLGKLGCFK